MSFSFTIAQGSTGPALQVVLWDSARPSRVVNLTDALSVQFRMRKDGAVAYTVNSAAQFITPRTTGGVRYNWIAADTVVAGEFQGNFLVTYADRVEVYPGGTYIPINIYPALIGSGP